MNCTIQCVLCGQTWATDADHVAGVCPSCGHRVGADPMVEGLRRILQEWVDLEASYERRKLYRTPGMIDLAARTRKALRKS